MLVKDGDGQVYWPAFDINDIGNTMPGRGYQIYLTAPQTLDYSGSS